MTSPQPAAADRDAALAARCAAGDRVAQRELFQHTKAAIHHTLFRILGSNQDMEDLLQESFLEIFRSVARFAGRSSLLTWCCAVASHVALGYLRGRKRPTVALSLVPDVAGSEPDAQRITLAREAARRLYVALDRIDPVQRVAFTLAVVDGRPLAEVADLTESSLSAVKTRVWRARKELDRLAGKDPVLSGYVVELAGQEEAR